MTSQAKNNPPMPSQHRSHHFLWEAATQECRSAARRQLTVKMAAAADPNWGGTFGRSTNLHDTNAFWRSTGRCLFDKVLGPNVSFDGLGLQDLEGDNSMLTLTEFTEKATRNPPLQKNGKEPHSPGTNARALEVFVDKVCEKLLTGDDREQKKEQFFPKKEVKRLSKQVKDNTCRVLMEGADPNEVLKNIFPIPREHNDRNRIFEPQQIPEESRNASRSVVIALFLSKRERFRDLLQLPFTHNGIGRGGECKFLSYDKMFLDTFYNILFTQWFQRKILKTSPSGFAVEFKHPVLCIFLVLGCFWACDNGLHRPPWHRRAKQSPSKDGTVCFPRLA